MLLTEPPVNFQLKAEVVAVLPFLEDRVLLLQRLPTHPQANLWCPPGGKIDHGESLKCAAVRELFEETGIQVEEDLLISLGKFYVCYPNGDFIFHLFKTAISEKDIKNIQIRNSEHQSFCIHSMKNISDLPLTPGLDECLKLAESHK